MDIRGKKALVTGAASGIGRAIALALAREGAAVLLVDIDEPNLDAVRRDVESLGARAGAVVCDLSQPDQIDALVRDCNASGERLDILVNCAGLSFYGHAADMSLDQWQSILAVNLLAPVRLVHRFLPAMAAQREAHILNVCSLAGLAPVRKMTAYQTSKFGLVGFSMGLRAEYDGSGVGVTTLCPGVVHTPMIEKTNPGKFKKARHFRGLVWTSAEVVAAKAIAAIRGNKGLVIVTPMARVLWWVNRLSPAFAAWLARSHRNPRKPA